MMFRSLLLSCSFLGLLGGGAVIAMEDDTQGSQNSITLKKEEILGETTKDEKELKQSRFLEQYKITDPKEIEIFKEFYNGTLVYYPYEDSYKGKVELSISDLEDPLNGEFDLSKCNGEYSVSTYLSINTGYRKELRPENEDKIEIWIAPRFLIERELETTAEYLKPIMGSWDHNNPIGIFRATFNSKELNSCNLNIIRKRSDPMGDVVWSYGCLKEFYPSRDPVVLWKVEEWYQNRYKEGFFMFTLTKQEKKEGTRQAAQLLKDPSLSPAALPKAALDEPASLRKPKASASISSPSKSSEDKDTVPTEAKVAVPTEVKDAVPAKAKPKGQKRKKKTVLFRIG